MTDSQTPKRDGCGVTDGDGHVAFDTLNDYADGLLGGTVRAEIDRHLASCGRCAAELDDLRRVLAMAAGAPRAILPPDDLWPELRLELERRKEVALPVAGLVPQPDAAPQAVPIAGTPSRRTRRERAFLAAAAVALVVGSSAVTAYVVRTADGELASTGGVRDSAGVSVAPTTIAAGFHPTEGDYLRTIGELRSTLDARRDQLSPAAIATVERSLAVIDAAIAEARAALAEDPRNATLVELLSASYERKLELLRRASELPSRT